MLFNQPESEYLQELREKLDIPRGEARARLLRELELSDLARHAAEAPAKPRFWQNWAGVARRGLGGGLIVAGAWLAGRRGDVL